MTTTARAVRFDHYGDVDVLHVDEVTIPDPSAGEVLVEIRAAGTNPGEISVRAGYLESRFHTVFPSGEGSDLAGVVVGVGPDAAGFAVGDEVLGFSLNRASHATHALVPAGQLIRKPEALSWEVAGSLYVVGVTAFAAARAVGATAGETVVVSAAAGGVGHVLVQLLVHRGVRVLGIASAAKADWLEAHGVVPVPYGEGLADRLRAAAQDGIDAFIDLYGPEYVQLAVDLGVPVERIETIIAFEKAAEVGAKAEGSGTASTPEVLTEMADLVASGAITLEIAATFPLDAVREAYGVVGGSHTIGKVVLLP